MITPLSDMIYNYTFYHSIHDDPRHKVNYIIYHGWQTFSSLKSLQQELRGTIKRGDNLTASTYDLFYSTMRIFFLKLQQTP